MELYVKGKKVVVTGGSKGIGYAIAEEFLKEGAKVTITGRNQQDLLTAMQNLSEIGEIEGRVVDSTDEKAVYQLAEKVAGKEKRIDVWVNNVGTNKARNGELYTEAEMDYLIATCFKSAVFGSQAAYLHMKESGGSIINVASLAARCATTGRSTIYAAMKSAIVNLSTTLAGEYAAYGIRVNAVLPGYTRTPLVESTFTKEKLEKLLQNNLLRRMADPKEIAKPVVFLASDAASYITASSLEISGGHNTVLNPEYSYELHQKKEIFKIGGKEYVKFM
ncbi:MAG: SDR family oxidoreductase [Lachnospiraceae bacterium]|nr:SDR family oxidoreductase [Lachnospiraceae bacterium]